MYWHPTVWLINTWPQLVHSWCSSLSQWTSLPHRWQLPNHPVVWFGTSNAERSVFSEPFQWTNHSLFCLKPPVQHLYCLQTIPNRYLFPSSWWVNNHSLHVGTWLCNVCPITKHWNLLYGSFYLFRNFQQVGNNEAKHLSNSMVKALSSIWGDFQCTSHFVIQLWWQVPPDGLANMQSFRFWRGWKWEQRLSVEDFMVLANSFFICLFICCFRALTGNLRIAKKNNSLKFSTDNQFRRFWEIISKKLYVLSTHPLLGGTLFV